MERLRIEHVTQYAFDAPVSLMPHRMLLQPRTRHGLRVASSTLDISPTPSVEWQTDPLDNSVAIAKFTGTTELLRIASTIVLEQSAYAPLDFMVDAYAVSHPFRYASEADAVLEPFRVQAWPHDGPALDDWLARLALPCPGIETFVLLDRISRAIQSGFVYRAREEQGVQSPAKTIAIGSGSCRDFAALYIEACRRLGLASRFVSGYHYAPGGAGMQGATHAWAEIYLPGPGWKGFDPTYGELSGAHHIAVAVACHPESVPPVAGSFLGSARATMRIDVKVSALAIEVAGDRAVRM